MKNARQDVILETLDKKNSVKVSELVDELEVTDMTIRRDLQELEDENLLIRVHGGARKVSNGNQGFLELSHNTKRDINPKEKKEIAKLIAENIKDHDIVYLGSDTTIELVYDYLDINHAKIITNSIYVFNKFKDDERFDLILIGGSFRTKTGSFAGSITNDILSSMHVEKAFIGVNAINENNIFNANEDEGVVQRTAFENAKIRYIIADTSKFNKLDFYQFYTLDKIDYLVTNKDISPSLLKQYEPYVKIIY
ncbi:DeoR/GlpR family DNA-binding transcription regulator [Allofustis seminis]|uniref:DeoR/GlpR family DNA-binding transcription regulator n=1 Tax=Allofustis seminis TaxID=166939 RepID=UPI00035E09DC|nr:DeoR/GlpR family DNA-binding transcription regulator [Allofustis seminis]